MLLQGRRAKLIALAILLTAAVSAVLIYVQAAYDERIYPGVAVQDVDVGGLTVLEATTLLAAQLADPRELGIDVVAGEHTWRLSWTDLGMGFDYPGTAWAAYEAARPSNWLQRVSLLAWPGSKQVHVETLVTPADPERIRSLLERAAALVDVAPSEAELYLTAHGITAVSGKPGQRLDTVAGVEQVLSALDEGRGTVTLVLQVVPPRLGEPEPAYTVARSLLAQPFVLSVDDPVTDYVADFTAAPDKVVTWLQPVAESTSDGTRLVLHVNDASVQAWLSAVASQIGPQRELDIAETLSRTIPALESGESRVPARILHPERTYVVAPGDNLFDIAYDHGFPLWRFREANPNIDHDALEIGMELIVPSLDVLLPQPIAPGKLIEINLTGQRLRAYQNGDTVFDFTCSTGMSSTPTIAGLFQVLFKEESAFAERWALDMPYFMAIYQEGPDFFNGIHELPIQSGGHRMWASALGWPASYGCVILDIGDAEVLYDWASVGTLVRIVGQAPRPVESVVEPQEAAESQ